MKAEYQRAFHALLKGIVTVKVQFDLGRKSYTYRAPKDAGIAVGDKVIVIVRGELLMPTVVQVDEHASYENENGIVYKWIVQKVDTSWYETMLERESDFETKFSQLLAERTRIEYLKELTDTYGEETVKALEESVNPVAVKEGE